MKKTQRHHGHEAEWKNPAHEQVRVYVWEWPVRFAHWIIFATIVSLSITGYYMHSPFIISHGRTAYVMGTVRFVHLLSGFAFCGAILLRVVWMFIGNQWSQWDQLIPTTKKRWKDFVDTAKYYGFMVWSPSPHIGHNAMAGAAYAAVFGMAHRGNCHGPRSLFPNSRQPGSALFLWVDSACHRHPVAPRDSFPHHVWILDVLHPPSLHCYPRFRRRGEWRDGEHLQRI